MSRIIDCFSYFDAINSNILELRLKLLYSFVDEFIISEANKTHTGLDIEYQLENRIQEMGINSDKIRYEKVDLKNISISNMDKLNCYGILNPTEDSINARSRERIQRDSILNHLDDYDDSDIFIVSDADEIINPENLHWIKQLIESSDMTNKIIKIPLVHLEGRADLRVYVDNSPMKWDRSMFICQKTHLKQCSPTQIRSNMMIPFEIVYLSENSSKIEDLGWHFSWMGTHKERMQKVNSFIHSKEHIADRLNSFNSKDYLNFLTENPKENNISLSFIKNSKLRKYNTENLPKIIWDLDKVKDYLLPD
jgi:hypothetical protein